MRKEELINQALEILTNDDDAFVNCIEELDSWNGYADGFRLYPMSEIDEFFYGCKIGDFLEKLSGDFHHTDEYFFDTVYGLESFDGDPVWHYEDYVDRSELIDALIEDYNHLDINWFSSELDEIIEALFNEDFDDEEDEAI